MTRLTLDTVQLTRRQVVAGGGGAVLALAVLGLAPGAALASPKDAQKLLTELTGGAALNKGRVHVTLPKLTDQGPFTRIAVSVDSPMSDADYVKSVHVFADGNPNPNVATYHFTPANGAARFAARIRLAKTQNVIAVAEMSNGDLYMAKSEVKVTIGGCGG